MFRLEITTIYNKAIKALQQRSNHHFRNLYDVNMSQTNNSRVSAPINVRKDFLIRLEKN